VIENKKAEDKNVDVQTMRRSYNICRNSREKISEKLKRKLKKKAFTGDMHIS
jgi:tRNA U34 2-thiouridine synthase MnmA/TrmU